MTDELHDAASFHVGPLVWFIAVSKSGAVPEVVSLDDPDIQLLFARKDSGEKCLPLFTDQEQAEDLAKSLRITTHRPSDNHKSRGLEGPLAGSRSTSERTCVHSRVTRFPSF
jgi:hypothetical protein